MEKIRDLFKRVMKQIKYKLWLMKEWIKAHKKKFGMGVAAAVLCIGCLCWIFLRTYHDYEVVRSITRKGDTSANYYFSDEGIVCYSKDGISFTNNNGEDVWNQVFGMESPKMSTCGDYIAIGDIGANSIYIFNGSGLEGRMNLEKPIQDVRISKQGVVAVILSDSVANQINLYNKTGDILASIKATIASSGYPLTFALSEDGTHLVVSYISFEGGNVKTHLVFYNFSNKENSNTPAGTFAYDGLFPKVEFVNTNTVVACGEEGFYTYQFNNTVSETQYRAYAAEAKSIFMTEKGVGIVTKNVAVAEEGKSVDKYLVEVYGFSGRRKASFTFNFDYKYISGSDKDIIFYNNQECEIYTYWGHRKFTYAFENSIESILPDSEDKQYIVLNAQSVETIRIK